MKHLLNWALSALAVWIVARVVPGFHVSGPLAALIAAPASGSVDEGLGARVPSFASKWMGLFVNVLPSWFGCRMGAPCI